MTVWLGFLKLSIHNSEQTDTPSSFIRVDGSFGSELALTRLKLVVLLKRVEVFMNALNNEKPFVLGFKEIDLREGFEVFTSIEWQKKVRRRFI